jgi:hypothetical protein
VDRIDIVDSSKGAATGFGPVMGNSDLNVPGPFNDPETGEVTNVHQVHFHLDRGASSQLIPHRFIDAYYWHGGFKLPRQMPDGPPDHEVLRPSENKLVVADPPGLWMSNQSDYPFKLDAHFYLMVSDKTGVRIAQIEYDVDIEKTTFENIPNKVNRIVATRKRDLVRNRDL